MNDTPARLLPAAPARSTRPRASAPFAAALALVLAGCFPVLHGSYFKPVFDAPGVEWLGDSCHGATGAPSRIVVPLADGGRLTASVETGSSGQAQAVLLSLESTAGGGPDWGDGRAVWRAAERERTLDVPMATGSRFLDWRAGWLVDPSSLGLPEHARDVETQLLWAATWPGVGTPPALTAHLPRILPDTAAATEAAPVALTPHLPPEAPGAWRRYRSREEHEAVRARVRACLTKADPKLCAFVEDSDRGFVLTVDAVEWDVRAWIYRPARESPLLAEFKAKVGRPLPWRPELTRPPLSPLPAPARERLRVSASWSAPLSSRVPAPRHPSASAADPATWVGAGGPTTVSETLRQTVRIALPADAADDFELRLPGKVLPGPLRFERRRLDAGLAPFNC